MRISAPNKLFGKIMKVHTGQDMAEIIVDVGDQAVTATITASAYSDMDLQEGDAVFAVFNSTVVSLIKDHHESQSE
ncbi:MAG TPA: TOBE domain-containing protein [Syntrophomonas sp.]|jgi:molybdopterin-binding protein|nr:TOBE domain-containing protein [Syntrophomonas sp.]HRW12117.1 TOBE domain-containing protein [Syntrophomonas sp.]